MKWGCTGIFCQRALLSETSVFASLASYPPSVGFYNYGLSQITVVLLVIKVNLQEAMHSGRKSEISLLSPNSWHFRKLFNIIKMWLSCLMAPKYSCKWVDFTGMQGEQPWKVQTAFNFVLDKVSPLLTKQVGWSSFFQATTWRKTLLYNGAANQIHSQVYFSNILWISP